MGLLKAEQNDLKGAEKHLKAALKVRSPDGPGSIQPLYHYSKGPDRRSDRPIARKAADLRPQEPRYGYTLAFYQQQKGNSVAAIKTLENLIEKQPGYADAYLLLGGIYQKQGKKSEAERVYSKALENEGITQAHKARIVAELNRLKK